MQIEDGLSKGRWAIYIDLEGFRQLYEQENIVLMALGELMEGVFRVGCQCYPQSPDRLFAHQVGDGFIIVSDFPEDSLDRPIAIALALLRHVAHSGRFAKASLAEGQFADIQSCYPSVVIDAMGSDGKVFLGTGVMTLFPVMGTALIRAYAVANNCPSGPLFAFTAAERQRLPSGLVIHETPLQNIIVVDWVHSQTEMAVWIAKKAGLNTPSIKMMEESLSSYCHTQNIKKEWSESVSKYLDVNINESATNLVK